MTLVYTRIRPLYLPPDQPKQVADTDFAYPRLRAPLLTCGVFAYSGVPLRGAWGRYGPPGAPRRGTPGAVPGVAR